ncbi:MAG: ABC transporter permease [Alphaproteobacteria bacterium]|nr:ABC transporter permease [Alphaproteobacteria bacterium]
MNNTAPHPPGIEKSFLNEKVTLKLTGVWVAKTAKIAEPLCLDLLKKRVPKTIVFDLAPLKEIDTAGVWLVQRTVQSLKNKGYEVTVRNESPIFQALSSHLETDESSFDKRPKSPGFFGKRLVKLGKVTVEMARLSIDLIIFLGQVAVGIFRIFLQPRRLRFASVVAHIEGFGVNALPIVILMSMALGVVLAYQGEEQLRRFGAEIYTINLVSISIVREVGILITAILVAGRTGSAITAQIGIMKINQEVDALNTLGLNPMEVLIIPRVLALIFVMPLLAFVSDLAGLLGGGIMVVLSLDVTPELYVHRIGEAITLWGFCIGILKAPVFGAIIAIVSCFQGMRVEGTSESIGICTTRSVVEGIFLVTIADALLSVFFSSIGV